MENLLLLQPHRSWRVRQWDDEMTTRLPSGYDSHFAMENPTKWRFIYNIYSWESHL